MSLFGKIQNFFTELREKDELTKKRWLIFFTSTSMAMVIFLWGFYINVTIKNLGNFTSQQAAVTDSPSKTFKNGLAIVSEQIGGKLREVGGKIITVTSNTNTVVIQGNDLNFVAQPVKDIKPIKLP